MKRIVFFVLALVFFIIFGCQKSTNTVPSSPETPTPTPTNTPTSTPVPSGKIVYQSNMDGDYDVYVYNFSTQSNKNITNSNTGYDGQPCWLANGTQIYFITDRSYGFGKDIYAVNEDGSSPIEKVGTSDEKYYPRKGNFGSSRHLFYHKYNSSTGKTEICAWDEVQGKEVVIFQSTIQNYGYCDYSTVKNKIVFVNDYFPMFQIYIANTDGTNSTLLTADEISIGHTCPKFSKDGNRIVYVSDSNSDGNYEIWVMNIDGTNKIKITNNNDNNGWPCFSSDDYWIVFVKISSSGNGDLYIIPATGGNEQKLNIGFSNTNETYPDWY
jgi:TolB protein